MTKVPEKTKDSRVLKNIKVEAIESEVINGIKVCDFDYGFLKMIIKNPIKFSMANKNLLELKTLWLLIRSTQPDV